MARRGVTPAVAKSAMRRDTTLMGAMLMKLGHADGMICGVQGQYADHLSVVNDVIGKRSGVGVFAAMNYLMLPGRSLFIADTHVNENPNAEQVAEIAMLAADEVKRFGVHPKVALLSHSNFGSSSAESALKMSRAAALLPALSSGEMDVDGEMHGDAALSEEIRLNAYPDSALKGEANVLVMPNIDAANISYNLIKMIGGSGVTIGPILLGAAHPVHILTSSSTVRRVVNMTAMAVLDALKIKR
jgi:malate dehydrogenase (oxaloacetate-decarboxylating)(NADP+)